jgi:hypothetical protein
LSDLIARFNAVSLVCESIHASYLAHWASSHAISFLVVVAGVAVSTGDSKSWHYIMVIAWELILLPTAAWLELSNTSIRHVLHVPVQHRYAILVLPLAVALRGLDPLSFKVIFVLLHYRSLRHRRVSIPRLCPSTLNNNALLSFKVTSFYTLSATSTVDCLKCECHFPSTNSMRVEVQVQVRLPLSDFARPCDQHFPQQIQHHKPPRC